MSTEETTEAFYIDRMRDHLRDVLGDPALDYLVPPQVVKGGMSGSAIYRLTLTGTNPESEWAGRPLICRAVDDEDLGTVAKEVVVHKTLHTLGYPIPDVLAHQDHADVLASPFLIMDALPGQSGMDRFFWLVGLFWLLYFVLGVLSANGIAEWSWPYVPGWVFLVGFLIVNAQWAVVARRLYRIPAESFMEQSEALGLDASSLQIETLLDKLESNMVRIADPGLRPGLIWLRRNLPPPEVRQQICHGDFHLGNVMFDKHRVSGVIDWINAAIASPEYDIAWMRTVDLFLGGPPFRESPGLFLLLRPFRWIAIVLFRLQEICFRLSGRVDGSLLRYYRALHSFRVQLIALDPRFETLVDPRAAARRFERASKLAREGK